MKCGSKGSPHRTPSREPVEVPHWDEKDSTSTLMDHTSIRGLTFTFSVGLERIT